MDEQDAFFELWATYSVRDHLPTCAFVADVLLYDRLVVPVPPAGDADELARWREQRWDPERQKLILDVLGDIVVQVPWGEQLRQDWREDYAAERGRLGDQLAYERSLPYEVTGRTLLPHLPAMAKGVVATTPFASVPEIERALELERRPRGAPLPPGTVSAVLATEFLIPADPRRSELELLQDAVRVAQSTNYREARAELHRFQQKFIRDEVTDLQSVEAAVIQMAALASQMRKETERERIWGGVRRRLEFAQVVVPAVHAVLTGGVVTTTTAAIGVALYGTTRGLRDPNAPNLVAPEAALVIDAGRKLAEL